ncbi:hypothetical protein [Longitalea arenae]|nr:hypothetical protein [Longitalea arenae]
MSAHTREVCRFHDRRHCSNAGKINEANERLPKGDVKYRFVIEVNSFKKA